MCILSRGDSLGAGSCSATILASRGTPVAITADVDDVGVRASRGQSRSRVWAASDLHDGVAAPTGAAAAFPAGW